MGQMLAGALIATMMSGAALAQVSVMIPAGPGGGWDSTGRQAMQAMVAEGLYRGGVNYTNRGGAGGTIGLTEFANQQSGKPDALAVFGAITLGAIELSKSDLKLGEFRPIARLTAEYGALAVRADSPHKTLADFVAALKADPGKTAVGGGSAGGIDHITLSLLAKSAGVPGGDLNYIPQTSGAETMTAIVNGTLAAGISGASEFAPFVKQKRVRILAITSGARLAGIDAPTFKEAGFDIEIANWRGFIGARNMPDDSYRQWVERFQRLSESAAWKKVLKTQDWEPFYLGGDSFGAFIASESERTARVLKESGIAK